MLIEWARLSEEADERFARAAVRACRSPWHWWLAFAATLGAPRGVQARQRVGGARRPGDGRRRRARRTTEGLLLTWIDDKGDFHVETRVADVPLDGARRGARRRPERARRRTPTGCSWSTCGRPRPDGTYPVRVDDARRVRGHGRRPPREDAARRSRARPARLPRRARLRRHGPQAPLPPARAVRGGVIIYGAEWCGACHDAARYLRSKGIPYRREGHREGPRRRARDAGTSSPRAACAPGRSRSSTFAAR